MDTARPFRSHLLPLPKLMAHADRCAIEREPLIWCQ